jgi:hypothetical protein
MIRNQDNLLRLLDEYELDIFTHHSLEERTGLSLEVWRTQLRILIRNGLVNIIEKGKYCRHNFRDEYVIVNYLANDGIIELPLSVWKRFGII